MLFSTLGRRVRHTTPYVYALIDSVTHMWYIGCRMAKGCHPTDLGRSYFTSSRIVRPLFKADPARFVCKILYIGNDAPKKEQEFLVLLGAAANSKSHNMTNGCGTFDAQKAANLTVLMHVGVHSRSKEQMTADANKMVAIHKPAGTGIFAPGVSQKGRDTQKRLGLAAFNPDNRRRGGLASGAAAKRNKTGIHAIPKEERSEIGKMVQRRRYKCAECELTGPATSIALHQKSKGHAGRITLGEE